MTLIRYFQKAMLAALCLSQTFLAANNYFDVQFVNNSGFADKDVYFIVKALDPISKKDCFIKFDPVTGIGACQVVSEGTSSFDFSYTADQLKNIKIPMVDSGRIYFSIGMPMDLYVSKFDGKIIDSDGFKPRDPNYFTLHDKVEFTYNDLGTWINPTAVDYYSLPLRIEQPGASSHLKAAGVAESYAASFGFLKNIVGSHDLTSDKQWDKLFLKYMDDGQETILRFVAPGKAMVKNMANTLPFDDKYLKDQSKYDFSYIDAVWAYYQNATLKIDASELSKFFALDDYLFTGHVAGDEFIFTNATGTYTERVKKPTSSSPFFAGAGDEFDHVNNTPKAIIVRQLTSAFEVGLLPAPDGTLIDKNYFDQQREAGNFYQPNAILAQTAQGPWYDLYAKAIHSFGEDQPIYAFAYDDALGQDGTLHAAVGKESSPPPVTITLGDMSGVKIPNPYTDDTKYTVTVMIGHQSQVEYNGQLLKHLQVLHDVSIPFVVKLNGEVANIYIKTPMVRPYFHGSDGIMVEMTGETRATVNFPGR